MITDSIKGIVWRTGLTYYVYVDNSNVWIEGMRVAAVASQMAPDIFTAADHNILDYRWKIDFGKLFEFAGGSDVGRAVLYGSKPPPNDSLWAAAKASGFEVVVHERNVANREKKVDTSMTLDAAKDSMSVIDRETDTVVIVAGDTDYVPIAADLVERGFNCEVLFWDQASNELKNICTTFISLNPYLEHLRLI